MVAVAVAEKEKLLHPRPLLQTDRVVAEKLAGNTDQRDVTIQQSHGQPRTNALCVFVGVVADQFRKKRDRISGPGHWIRQIGAGRELEPFFAHRQRWLSHFTDRQRRRQFHDLACQRLTERFVSLVRPCVGRHVAGGALHENRRGARGLLDGSPD